VFHLVSCIPQNEMVVLAGYMNEDVGSRNVVCDGMHGVCVCVCVCSCMRACMRTITLPMQQSLCDLHLLMLLCLLLLLTEGNSYDWRWLASSLNPYYEGNSLNHMITDDRFMVQTSDHWYFGADNTGDILSSHFIESLISECSKKDMNSVHLVCITAVFIAILYYIHVVLLYICSYDSIIALAVASASSWFIHISCYCFGCGYTYYRV